MPTNLKFGRGTALSILAFCLSLATPSFAAGDVVLGGRERIDFDRPESWGMQFAAAVASFTGTEAPRARRPGEVELGIDGGSVPSLSTEERRIGFDGTTEENIDRVDAFGRLRATIGLGRDFALELGLVPPIQLAGLKPRFAAVALARPIASVGRLRWGARLGAQSGTIEGDITCSARSAAAGNDPIANPLGCEAPSNDKLETDELFLELVASLAPRRDAGFEPFLSIAAHRLDGTFRVGARYGGIVDHSRLETSGTYWSGALGASGPIAERWRLSGELFYAPLEIRRPGRSRSIDGVTSLRVGASLRLR